ncbi:MAG: DUF1318 domain-containing protein [Spartobacteria bacterium]
MKSPFATATAATALLLASCAAPTVNLATPEPIKVDIAVRLDVYQHAKEAAKKSTPASAATDPVEARRNRMAHIQTFKNSRLVGEGRDALLAIRVDTPGDYGDFIRKTVDAENADRMALMKSEAEKQKTSLPQIQSKQANLAAKLAFKGEWIEIVKDNGSAEWIQKEE